MRLVRVATCNLNQWSLDFAGNLERICCSIARAREAGARYRLGPELEVSGYGCEDHFLEPDTFVHSWEVIAEIIARGYTDDILVDLGAPVLHRHVAYNCRVLLLNRRILLIRPKLALADDGNYRESRWFTAWPANGRRALEKYPLPDCVRQVAAGAQAETLFGEALLDIGGVVVASETCEELFTPDAPHIRYSLNGCDIIGNGSGSHHNLRKLNQRIDLLRSATAKGGGAYLYANQQGCDGGRLYYDGCALICINGEIVAQASQFSIADEVEVITATIDLDEITAYRIAIASRGVQAASTAPVPRIDAAGRSVSLRHEDIAGRIDGMPTGCAFSPAFIGDASQRAVPASVDPSERSFRLVLSDGEQLQYMPSQPVPVRLLSAEEEIAYGPACWLWDYLRRSGASGFFLPLSGGADSSATATIVASMCRLVAVEAQQRNDHVIREARRILGLGTDAELTENAADAYIPRDAHEFASRILHTAYMRSENSSRATRERAAQLAKEIGAYHLDLPIDAVVAAVLSVFTLVAGERPRFRVQGGSAVENAALQNIQARIRMVLSYLFAQLLPWARGHGQRTLLVLGSANVDEALRGYLTKYDASSADINPIGGISKHDLRRFLLWAVHELGFETLQQVVEAPPTAELEPITGEYVQTDEADMGMTYAELTVYGRLRKIGRCGPVSMYERLSRLWKAHLSPSQVAEKVKFFFRMYSVNRHKMTVLTPSVHCENYSPEDNRFDLRPFLYNIRWPWQFRQIDALTSKVATAASERDALPSERDCHANLAQIAGASP
ncbi:glutamine-dependent NAD synthetase [Cyanidioschyzon merolae strain 10D]|uniref:Glutamine-dependent NAD(+) synthetase n=1 Tax=Cyanidioschyzon merolae (strain NIES-3377 / 10D) TaxID=280699 RepID=M1VIK4_CYAM1|nr:glutamine-dependent NAD synthetase [Cyanidioschyzon merolae strain 10D]BAM83417.1 glutamine-dependent NAD synthetase [Cyanidioschyzon merolae strain 10D]|eukprot:XP_005539453.1 glutamine-dependent NAD synthetase [Cyanidioschyzon merolae strain 10D]